MSDKFIGGSLTVNQNGKYDFTDPSLLQVSPTGSLERRSIADWLVGDFTGLYIFNGTGDVAIQSQMNCVEISKTVDAITTVYLPTTAYVGETHTIKDGKGTADTYNITIDAGSSTIDGDNTTVLSNKYQATTLYYNGSAWRII